MGGTPSKHQEIRDGSKALLSRSASVPTSSNKMHEESSNKVSWKSRLFSMSQSYNRGKSIIFDGVASKLKPVEEEAELDLEDLDINECVNGLERERQLGFSGAVHTKTGRLLNKCMTFQPVAEAECQRRLVAPRRKPREEGGEYAGYVPPFNNFLCRDQSMGLQLLLNPPPSSSQSMLSPSRGVVYPPERTLSLKGSFNSRHGSDITKRAFSRVCMDDASPLEPQWVTAPTALSEMDVPLFDPSILATFEKAVDDLACVTWQSSPAIASESIFVSSEMCKDPAKPKLLKDSGRTLARLKSLQGRAAREDRPDDNASQLRSFSFLSRKLSFSKVFSLKNNDECNWSSETYLDKFVKMCPSGCEGKVVLYFTTLRGVRKTFENCHKLRLILKGFRVHVDERDVWMHSKFRQELTDVMGMALSVPRLFIMGRYIGGADEVELLHEEGILAKLLEGLPTERRQACKVCADVRLIICTACNGSRKIAISNDVTERCSKCNENGLIMCPLCDS